MCYAFTVQDTQINSLQGIRRSGEEGAGQQETACCLLLHLVTRTRNNLCSSALLPHRMAPHCCWLDVAAAAATAAGGLAWRQVLGGFHGPLQQDIAAAQKCSTTQVGANTCKMLFVI
jgi:hypothetical protein